MILANTVFAYPVLLLSGWIGLTLSMTVELTILLLYLRHSFAPLWIAKRFLIANLFSAVFGLLILVVVRHPPSGTTADNVRSLALGMAAAFVLSLFLEGAVFLRGGSRESAKVKAKAVFMGNFFSYSVILAIHLVQM